MDDDVQAREPVDILVVDDRPENVLALQSILSSPDYNVVTAASGGEALRSVLKHDFAVILLDVVMPIMDGFETARLITQREASRETPIIFLTAAGTELNAISKAYSLGAVDYLVKPIEPAIVKAKVAVFVDLFRKTERIRRQEAQLREAERARSEQERRASEAEYESTFEKAAAGIAHLSPEGRWLRTNQRLCDMLGRSKGELLQLKLHDVAHADDVGTCIEALRRVATGELDSHRGEARYVHTNGSTVWVNVTASLLASRPKTVIAVIEDVTERKRAQEAQAVLARASELLLDSFDYETSLAGVARCAVPGLADFCVIDLVGKDPALPTELCAAHVDPQQLGRFHQLREQGVLDPKACAQRVDRTHQTELIAYIEHADILSAAHDPASLELILALRLRTAIIVPLMMRGVMVGTMTFICAGPGRPYGAKDVTTAEDLAHRVALGMENSRLYREAQLAIGVRDEFLSIASHELRTPLTPLQIQLQRLLGISGRAGFEDMSREQLRTILQRSSLQVGRLAALIDNLLDISRLSAGRLRLDPEQVDLSELARDVVGRFSEAAVAAGCTLTLQAEAAVVGTFDRLRLEQVLGNLLANAIKYGRGHPVEVQVESDGEQATVSVEDHGIGIAPDKLEVIFERFERAASARSYGGLGLGLYIARQIVDAHRGSIAVRSQPSSGSVFTLTVPLKWAGGHRVDSDRRAEDQRGGVPLPRAEVRTVLLVEDDLDVRDAICDLLESHGYRVVSACNGQEALERLRGGWGPPDVILLDLMMPVMDGWQFRTEQQKSPEWARIPVVLVSGDNNAGASASAIDAAGFLKKPPTAEDLLGLVDRVCNERKALVN